MAASQENMYMAKEPSTPSSKTKLYLWLLHSDIKFGSGLTLASLKLLNFCYLPLHQPPETQSHWTSQLFCDHDVFSTPRGKKRCQPGAQIWIVPVSIFGHLSIYYLLKDLNAKTRHFTIFSYTHFTSRMRLWLRFEFYLGNRKLQRGNILAYHGNQVQACLLSVPRPSASLVLRVKFHLISCVESMRDRNVHVTVSKQ